MSNIKSYRSSADALLEDDEDENENERRHTKTPPDEADDDGDRTFQNASTVD